MGSGTWTTCAYNAIVRDWGFASADAMSIASTQDVYRAKMLDPMLNPHGVMRECFDSDEHPETIPVILGLDVTGSMGPAATMCAGKLDEIMTSLYSEVKDVEFMMMGIGDLAYDHAPIQATQFESDIRILDQTAKIYMEGGGGGNGFESYTAAWYFGLNHTNLDCWKRGKKGIIITLGDEPLNPYLPGYALGNTLGASTEDVDTKVLYEAASKKFDIYHIAITNNSCYCLYEDQIKSSFGKVLGERLYITKSDELPKIISNIVRDHMVNDTGVIVDSNGISW